MLFPSLGALGLAPSLGERLRVVAGSPMGRASCGHPPFSGKWPTGQI